MVSADSSDSLTICLSTIGRPITDHYNHGSRPARLTSAVRLLQTLVTAGEAGDRGTRNTVTESDDERSDERSNRHASKSLFPILNVQHAGTIPQWTEQVVDSIPHKAPSIKSIRTVSAATTKSLLHSIFALLSDSADTEQTIANDPMFNFKYGGLPDKIDNYGNDGHNTPTVKLTKGLLHTLLNASLQTPANGDLLKVLGCLTDATPADQPEPEPNEPGPMDVDNAGNVLVNFTNIRNNTTAAPKSTSSKVYGAMSSKDAGAGLRGITKVSRGSALGSRTNISTTLNRPVSKTSAHTSTPKHKVSWSLLQ
ncbi:hypothetical protein BJ138DRAFT_1106324 [Hygrophoropsis aurantiaca]|uniref:Uncharacterized protein n=1 Tax=Hygrophoropsis aurantiaca TaxID=72124 RepID=A0ACB7ZVX3_9AGAM|nr:hypothetical protein BJ138DRAFT_1106324 [Hygrophoropsis aurantiaca]